MSRSESAKTNWSNPEYKEKMILSHIGKKQSDASRSNQSGTMKKIMNTLEKKKFNSELVKKQYLENPNLIKCRSDTIQRRWKTDNLRTTLVIGILNSRCGGIWYGNVKYPRDNEKYCEKFTGSFRERVRAYWGWECVVCGVKENGYRLPVHHVHYDKKMCCNGSPRDVVPLCRPCHTATLYNRDLWEKLFTDLIYSEEHNGKCFLTKEEMKELLEN
jgi:hypothetical protein